jgi:hypothetical protein
VDTHLLGPRGNFCSHQASKRKYPVVYGNLRACGRKYTEPSHVSHSFEDSKLFCICRCKTDLGPFNYVSVISRPRNSFIR